MRKLFLLSFVVVLASCSNNSELENWGLNGNVKSVFERMYEAEKKFGNWEPGDLMYTMHNKVNFDNKGLYTNMEYYGYDMELSIRIIPVRESGVIIEETNYDGDGNLQSRTLINQISKNDIESETFDTDNNKTYQSKITRKNGRITKTIQTIIEDGKESKTYTILFEYDKDGNLTSRKMTNEKDKSESFSKFEYLEFDDKGNWTKRLVYENSDEPECISVREIEYY